MPTSPDNMAGEASDKMPLEFQLELLVDDELPEADRRDLLRSLDRQPENWRELSLRFLERQAERASVKQLIAGAPALTAEAGPYPFPARSWMRRTFTARHIAAGLLIATGSALLTLMALHSGTPGTGPVARGGEDKISVQLPGTIIESGAGERTGEKKFFDLEVPVSAKPAEMTPAMFLPTHQEEPTRRQIIIVPDPERRDNAVAIPVNTLPNVGVY